MTVKEADELVDNYAKSIANSEPIDFFQHSAQIGGLKAALKSLLCGVQEKYVIEGMKSIIAKNKDNG